MGSNKLKSRGFVLVIAITIFIFTFQSCGIYSFTGAEIVGETISINYFQNKAPLIQPTLSQTFTDELRNKFTSQTKLNLITGNADLHLEGEITGYSIQPVALQANETAAKSRLTIIVNVRFTNKLKPKDNFEQSFTQFYDFDSGKTLTEVESELNATIIKQLVEDIFNKAVVNW
jgi:hypothetical protein